MFKDKIALKNKESELNLGRLKDIKYLNHSVLGDLASNLSVVEKYEGEVEVQPVRKKIEIQFNTEKDSVTFEFDEMQLNSLIRRLEKASLKINEEQ